MKIAKKLLTSVTILGLLGGISSFAQTNVVYSVNMVGFQKTEVGAVPKLMAAPFIKSGTNSLSQILGDQSDSFSDLVFVFTPGVGYTSFVDVGGGNWVVNAPPFNVPATDDLLPGSGFFFANGGGAATNDIVIVGEVVQASVITNAILPGLSIVSNPYSSDLDLNATNVTLGAILAFTDFVYTSDDNGYTKYVNTGASFVENAPPFTTPMPVIPSGDAFFIENNSGGTLQWVQPSLY